MNRSLRKNMRQGCAYRKRGGGFSVGSPLVEQPSSDWDFAVKAPLNSGYSDCTFAQRPGQLFNEPNPALAQVPMAGGRSRRNRRGLAFAARKRGGACGCMMQRGGACPCMMRGGRRTRKMRGGSYGYSIDPSVSVGGEGPNVAPLHAPVPCDARAGSHGMDGPHDPRAPADLYSLTPNQAGGTRRNRKQRGGQAALGNAFDDSCYRAPGSSLPVYNASVAGFHFTPSTEAGATLPDGVTAFNEVVAHAARTGGARRRRSNRSNRKNKSRKNRK